MKYVAILTLILALPAAGFAATIFVPDQYKTIQSAIDAASNGDTIIVRAGIYNETINLRNKAVTLTSEKGPDYTVIDGGQNGSVVTFDSGETTATVLEGFIIINGSGTLDPTGPVNSYYGGGIFCQKSDPIIANNIIIGNQATHGGGIHCRAGSPLMANNTIVDNGAKSAGGGLHCDYQSQVTITNTIFWDNYGGSGPEVYLSAYYAPSTVTIDYSDLKGGQASVFVEPACTLNWGKYMIDLDPLFVDPAAGDLHLTFPSPCRDEGGNSAPGIQTGDLEGDPRTVLGRADIGADEFYFHLYHSGTVTPGGAITINCVGAPGFPIILALGTGIQNPPQPTPYGMLYLTLPPAAFRFLGPIPASGVYSQSATVPGFWNPGDEKPIQALIGPLGGATTRLTNLMVLKVE